MRRFRRIAGGALVATFDADETRILRELASEIAALLGEAAADGEVDLADPAVARLLPDAYRDDVEASAEFRRFTSAGLAGRKVANARLVVHALGISSSDDPVDGEALPRTFLRGSGLGDVTVVLDEQEALAWLTSLADIRLALAARLGIEKSDEEAGREGAGRHTGSVDERSPLIYAVYDWLAYVQDSLVQALDRP